MQEKKQSRIKMRNEKLILEAAEKVFAEAGYHGATLEKSRPWPTCRSRTCITISRQSAICT